MSLPNGQQQVKYEVGIPASFYTPSDLASGIYFLSGGNGAPNSQYSGAFSTVGKTTDGLNWKSLFKPKGAVGSAVSGPKANSYSAIWVKGSDQNTIILVGQNGAILKTTDAGSSWTTPTFTVAGGHTVSEYLFTSVWGKSDGSKIYATGYIPVTSISNVFISVDGGNTFTVDVTGVTINGDALNWIPVALWGDDATGLWVGTIGGGIFGGPKIFFTPFNSLYTLQTSRVDGASIVEIHGFGSTLCATNDFNNDLPVTTNGGSTWTNRAISDGKTRVYLSTRVLSGHIYVLAKNNTDNLLEVHHSTNNGVAWTRELFLPIPSSSGSPVWTYNTSVSNSRLTSTTDGSVFLYALINAGGHVLFGSSAGSLGASWIPKGGQIALNAVWASSPTDVYVGGDFGILYHWDGATWAIRQIPQPSNTVFASVVSIWGSGPTDIYIADTYPASRSDTSSGNTFPSRILHSTDGINWTTQLSVTYSILEIFGFSSSKIYAVGGDTSGSSTVGYGTSVITGSRKLLVSDGSGSWSAVTSDSPTEGALSFVAGSGLNDVWTGGGDTTFDTIFRRVNDSGNFVNKGKTGFTSLKIRPTCALSVSASEVLVGTNHLRHPIIRINDTTKSWKSELAPTYSDSGANVLPPVSLAKTDSTHFYAVTGVKQYALSASSKMQSQFLFSSGNGVWDAVSDPGISNSIFSKVYALSNGDVYIIGGGDPSPGSAFVGKDNNINSGPLIFKFNGSVSLPVLAPTAPIVVAKRKWTNVGAMVTPRGNAGLVRLTTGPNANKVLAFGGVGVPSGTSLSSSELYDPVAKTWSAGPAIGSAIGSPRFTKLSGGKVLVLDGLGTGNTVKLYDPVANSWSSAANLLSGASSNFAPLLVALSSDRAMLIHSTGDCELYDLGGNTWTSLSPRPGFDNGFATILNSGTYSGKVFVVDSLLTSVYDDSTNRWTVIANTPIGTYDSSFLNWVLPNGKILLTRKAAGGGSEPSSYVFDPVNLFWVRTDCGPAATGCNLKQPPTGGIVLSEGVAFLPQGESSLTSLIYDPGVWNWKAIVAPTTTFVSNVSILGMQELLADGTVLVCGGQFGGSSSPTPKIYEIDGTSPSVSVFQQNSMKKSRSNFAAVVLQSGKALAIGGGSPSGNEVESYDLTTGFWSFDSLMSHIRTFFTANLLSNGKVLVAGGSDSDRGGPGNTSVTNTAELYNPATKVWTLTGQMGGVRADHGSALLTSGPNSGKVMVVGGMDDSFNPLATAEVYDPGSDTWTGLASMASGRVDPAVVIVSSGKVYAISGTDINGDVILDFEVYDPVANTWSIGGGVVGGFIPSAVTNGSKILVFGEDENTGDVIIQVIDSADNSVTTVVDASFSASVDEGAATILTPDGKALITYNRAVWVFSFDDSTFTRQDDLAAAHFSHRMVQLADRVLIIGG